MSVLYWNARGIANDSTRFALAKLVCTHKPLFVCLYEPFIAVDSVPVTYWRSLGLRLVATNDRGLQTPNLWFLCHEALKPLVLSATSQQITISVSIDGIFCLLTTVYAKTTVTGRRQLWHDLSFIHTQFAHCP